MDDLFRRWKTLQLVEPIYVLDSRGMARADVDHDRYDVKSLVLSAIDHVVAKQASFDDNSATLNRLQDHIRERARSMFPDDPARGWVTVTRLVLDMLLNDGQHYRYEWRPPDGGHPRPWRFRLLRMIDSPDGGTAVAATDEAIVLYLQALDVDLADREMATRLMLSRQMEAGEFDRARRSALEARRYAEGVATQLRERLDDTRRDIRSVDWDTDMPARLTEALGRVVEQIDLDRHITELAEAGLDSDDPSSVMACQAVLNEVTRSQDVHVRLEREIQRAVPVYLEAQERQRLRPRGVAALVDLTTDLLDPLIVGHSRPVLAVGHGLAQAGLGARVTPQFSVDDVLSVLLRPIQDRTRRDPEVDEPVDLVEVNDDNIGEHVAEAAADHLATATAEGPVRLSTLLATSPVIGPPIDGPDELSAAAPDESAVATQLAPPATVADVVWSGSLWTWVSATDASGDEAEDVGPSNRQLAAVLSTLAAVDDRVRLPEGIGYQGADLLVGRAHHLLTTVDPDRVGTES